MLSQGLKGVRKPQGRRNLCVLEERTQHIGLSEFGTEKGIKGDFLSSVDIGDWRI